MGRTRSSRSHGAQGIPRPHFVDHAWRACGLPASVQGVVPVAAAASAAQPSAVPLWAPAPLLVPSPVIARAAEGLMGPAGAETLVTLGRVLLRLEQDPALAPPRSVAITSAGADDGKTLVAVQLACAAVRGARRVLLIDSNLAQPDLSALFGLSASPGLTELIQGRLMPEDAIRPVTLGYAVLPAGGRAAAGSSLLASRRTSALLRALKRSYDLIILDAAHSAWDAQTALPARGADAVIVVARMLCTRRDAVDGLVKRLRQAGDRVIGCILTHAPRD